MRSMKPHAPCGNNILLRVTTYRLICCLAFALVALGLDASQALAQRSYRQNQSVQRTPQTRSGSSVSRDLLQIYQSTKGKLSQQQVSSIVQACTRIQSSPSRSQVDRNYAQSLLGWALNRRGELRNDQAADLVRNGEIVKAEQIDRQAAKDFEKALELDPDNWRVHHNYAISLAMKGEYEQAIAELTTAIEIEPEYANSHFNRGELYYEIGEYETAITDYSTAISLDEQDAQYYNSRAHAKFALDKYDAAVEDYVQATEVDSKDAEFHADLGDAYQFLGLWEKAATSYQAAIKANGSHARAYQHAAWLMATCPKRSVRNSKLALTAAQKAIQLSERNAETLDTLAAALASLGRHADAAEIQNEALAAVQTEGLKLELTQRLQLYRRGQVFRQAQPKTTGDMVNRYELRTANRQDELDR